MRKVDLINQSTYSLWLTHKWAARTPSEIALILARIVKALRIAVNRQTATSRQSHLKIVCQTITVKTGRDRKL
jgi:hypothetical protein